jgi:hypothetical protein
MFIQVKYHVDQRGAYTSKGMALPVSSKSKTSFLQRLKRDYDEAAIDDRQKKAFRFKLYSNWNAQFEDPLLSAIRDDGRLPDNFVSGKVTGEILKIRKIWLDHLNVTEDVFKDLISVFLFKLSAYSLQDMTELANAKLKSCGLVGVDPTTGHNGYSAYLLKKLRDGRLRISREQFLEDVKLHNFRRPNTVAKKQVLVAFCTYSKGTEHLQETVDYFWDKRSLFSGSSIPSPEIWQNSIAETLRAFGDSVGRTRVEHHIHLECHLTIAYLVGRMWHDKTGISAFPFQKGPIPALWKPSETSQPENWKWCVSTSNEAAVSPDVVCIISGNRNIESDVRASMAEKKVQDRRIIHFSGEGPGPFKINNANHCYDLALQAREEILRLIKVKNSVNLRLHLYMSCPNSLAYFLGQQSMAMTRCSVQCYEFVNMKYQESAFITKEIE